MLQALFYCHISASQQNSLGFKVHKTGKPEKTETEKTESKTEETDRKPKITTVLASVNRSDIKPNRTSSVTSKTTVSERFSSVFKTMLGSHHSPCRFLSYF
uniref:Uncharacterized protein n=1 Tax=Arundo donax TaxID=35708 RepID=A0A0A9D273_ARUDO